MTKRIEVSASAFTELANALRVHDIGSKNGSLELNDVEIVRGAAPDHFNKFEIQILKVIGPTYGIPLDSMKRETPLGGDSLDFVEMIMAIEDELGVEIHDADVPSAQIFYTVQDVLNFAERHKCRT